MYTTLQMLKQTRACIPGYARLAMYFGTKKSTRTLKIPLWVIGLIGGVADLEWAIENAMFVDDKDFAEFRSNTLPGVLFSSISTGSRDSDILEDPPSEKNLLMIDLRKALKEASSSDAIERALLICKNFGFAGILISGVNQEWFTVPVRYVRYVHVTLEQSKEPPIGCPGFLKFPYMKRLKSYFNVTNKKSVTESFAELCLGHSNIYEALLDFTLANVGPRGSGMTISKIPPEGKNPSTYHGSVNLSKAKDLFRVYNMLLVREADASVLVDDDKLEEIVEELSKQGIHNASELGEDSPVASAT